MVALRITDHINSRQIQVQLNMHNSKNLESTNNRGNRMAEDEIDNLSAIQYQS